MWTNQRRRNPIPKYLSLIILLFLGIATPLIGQEQIPSEGELLSVLRTDASVQAKSTACRQLARVATKEAVPVLAALLPDETLSHMARYAMERIEDPSVDQVLRDALDTVEGRPLLGVMGSLGVRRDAAAVPHLAKLLKSDNADTAQAAARALGSIGTPEAGKSLESALPNASGTNQLAICEGLLRCAEAMAAEGQTQFALTLYDRLRGISEAPHQVRAAALRGAIHSRGKEGVALLLEAVRGPDYAMAAAAVRTAMEMPVPEFTDALVAEVANVAPERQGLLIVALAECGESQVMPAVLNAAKSDNDRLRILAFRALKRIGDASCVPALLEAAQAADQEVAQAAIDSLVSLQDPSVDNQITEGLTNAEGERQVVLIQLAGRRRIAAAAPALWKAADNSKPDVRSAALTSLGTMLDASQLPQLTARLATATDERVTAALDKAIQEVAMRSTDRESVAKQLIAALSNLDTATKARIFTTLNVIGGDAALQAVAAAARAENQELRDAAYRVLGQWKSADVAPILLQLHNSVSEQQLKVRTIRAYIRIARQFDMPLQQRAEMCRTALKIADRDADKQLVLEVLLRYPSEEMREIALEAAQNPALKDQAMLVVMGMASKGVNRAELGRALAQGGQKPVKLEILKAEYGAGDKVKDVTDILRKYAKNYRIIFLPSTSYNATFEGDPAVGTQKQLKIRYKIDGKESEVSFGENATILLPMPK